MKAQLEIHLDLDVHVHTEKLTLNEINQTVIATFTWALSYPTTMPCTLQIKRNYLTHKPYIQSHFSLFVKITANSV